MKHTAVQNESFVLFSQHGRWAELVSMEDGRTVHVPVDDLVFSTRMTPPIEGFVPFHERPREFLTELRSRRALLILGAKKRAQKTSPHRVVKKKPHRVSDQRLARLARMEPTLRLEMAEELGVDLDVLQAYILSHPPLPSPTSPPSET